MSLESAKAFLERLKTDEEFARAVSGLTDEIARMAFIEKAGFSFSPSDVEKASTEVPAAILTTPADGVGKTTGAFVADYPDEKS